MIEMIITTRCHLSWASSGCGQSPARSLSPLCSTASHPFLRRHRRRKQAGKRSRASTCAPLDIVVRRAEECSDDLCGSQTQRILASEREGVPPRAFSDPPERMNNEGQCRRFFRTVLEEERADSESAENLVVVSLPVLVILLVHLSRTPGDRNL